MKVVQVTIRYLVRLLKLWIIWFWFLALDGLGLIVDTFAPGFSPPRWLYWAIPAVGFLVANVKLFAEMESEQRQLSPRLNLVFGDFPSCIQQFTDNDHALTLFRVGLINQGGRTIENVRVSLEQLEPQNIPFGPINLWFMHQRQANEEFRLHPLGTQPGLFVDVIQDGFINDPPERILILRYAVSGVPNIIRLGNYRLTLLAEGQDVQPCRKSFLVTWNGEDINFMEERSAH